MGCIKFNYKTFVLNEFFQQFLNILKVIISFLNKNVPSCFYLIGHRCVHMWCFTLLSFTDRLFGEELLCIVSILYATGWCSDWIIWNRGKSLHFIRPLVKKRKEVDIFIHVNDRKARYSKIVDPLDKKM